MVLILGTNKVNFLYLEKQMQYGIRSEGFELLSPSPTRVPMQWGHFSFDSGERRKQIN